MNLTLQEFESSDLDFDEVMDDLYARIEALEKSKTETTETEKEPKYECGNCGGKFAEKYKRCPCCGIEFA